MKLFLFCCVFLSLITLADVTPNPGGGGGGTETPAAGDTGEIQFNSGDEFEADNDLFWDNTNKRIGLGTQSPQRDLHILSAAGEPTLMFTQNGQAADNKHWQYTVSSGDWYVQAMNDAFEGDSAILANRTNGSVVDVSIYSTVKFPDYGNGDVTITGGNGTVSSSSDARMKNIVGPFERGMEAILKIQPQTFTWKNGDPKFEQTGFVAQNVETAIPEAITMAPNGMRSLDSKAIMAALVNAVKELDARCPQPAAPRKEIPLKPIQVMKPISELKKDPKRNPPLKKVSGKALKK